MVSTLTLVLLVFGVYWLLLVFARERGILPAVIGTQGPVITVHTQRFSEFIDRIAQPTRFWRAWGNFGVGVAIVIMVASFGVLALAAITTVQEPMPTAVNQPRNVLVIPGINDFLPLSVAGEIILGLVIALVVHEGGHGILCRVGDIEIKSMGLALLGPIPIGAFVEPDDESRKRADRGDQTRMFAAGVMNNFAITIVAFLLLFGPVIGSISVAPGAAVGAVLPGSAADDAGIQPGDRIIGVNEQAVTSNEELGSVLAATEGQAVQVRVADADGTRTTTVTRSLLVTTTTTRTPFGETIQISDRITAVNGMSVDTEEAFFAALAQESVVTLETASGDMVTGPAGAAVGVHEDGPAANAGVPPGSAVVTEVNGERIVSANELSTVLSETSVGESVHIVLYIDGERHAQQVVLGENPNQDSGFLGVDVAPGVSGITVSDFGTRLYPAGLYLGLLGGDGGLGGSFFGRIAIALQLPLASVTGSGLPFNFAGFTGINVNFYEVNDPFGVFGNIPFLLANVLFWTGWINLNLGVFNCIPGYPLDGGHILRTSTESIVSRLPIQRRRALTSTVTTSVGLLMLVSLLLTIFGPQILT